MKRMMILLTALLCALTLAGGCSSEPEGAVWHTVTFDSRGGTAVQSQQVRDGNPVRRPDAPVREGYFLNGWYTDAEASEEAEWDFDTDRVTGDLTLYAGWTAQSDLTPTASLVYELNEDGGSYTVTDFKGEETQLVIPAEHEGLPVTAIQGPYGTGAFARTAITSAVIPDSVEVIGQNTFHNCSDLAEVVLSAGSRLREIGNNAFSGCSALERFYLPAGTTTLGTGAFNNCGGLSEFTVAEGNTAFRAENGHLIENATDTLLRGVNHEIVPESVRIIGEAAFRRASGISELYIPASVTAIGDYFIADSSIETILYAGSESEWNALSKTDMWNYGNREVAVTCSAERPEEGGGILVVYFSATGNTEGVAEILAQSLGAGLWEIEAADPYTEEDLDYYTGGRADQEQEDENCRPGIAETIGDFSQYDTVFLGHPIWHGIAPRIIQTFLESYDFSGKEVHTFSTSGSSSGSAAFAALERDYPSVNFVDNLHLTSRNLANAQTLVNEWLADLGLA